jgi:6-pyruvoyltetrahydropterin/6-carboxytetrahydropterin synthase
MYEVEITEWFSAAHRLRDYRGKCERLHGHNYRVQVAARSGSPGKGGMVIDFGDLKSATREVLENLDHNYLNDMKPFDQIEPSAENVASFLFNEVAALLGNQASLLYSVAVWESSTSKATYFKDETPG